MSKERSTRHKIKGEENLKFEKSLNQRDPTREEEEEEEVEHSLSH